MPEHRIVFALRNFAAHQEELLDRLLALAPDCGPVVGWEGDTTDVTLTVDADDSREALQRATRLIERAVADWPAKIRVNRVERIEPD